MVDEPIVASQAAEDYEIAVELYDKDGDVFTSTYKQVNFLANGWIECIGVDENPDIVDYHPPDHVVTVYGSKDGKQTID